MAQIAFVSTRAFSWLIPDFLRFRAVCNEVAEPKRPLIRINSSLLWSPSLAHSSSWQTVIQPLSGVQQTFALNLRSVFTSNGGQGATHRELRDMKRNGWTQGKGFSCVMAVAMAALLIVAAKTVYDYRNDPVKGARADARTETYFAKHSEPFCAFEGVWHDWEDDETTTLGCLEVKGDIREGSYSSAMGPRATSNFRMSGTYDLDSDSSMRVIGKDREGKGVKFTIQIYVDDTEYPTQIIAIDTKGERRVYIWQRKE